MRVLAKVLVCSLLLGGSHLTVAFGGGLAPTGAPWDAGDGFPFEKKVRRAASGIACPAGPAVGKRCLVAFDEGIEARFIVLQDNSYEVDIDPVILLDSAGELDAEGAATDGEFFYVTGSHAVKRGDCADNAVSHNVIRFKGDPATGGAMRGSDGGLAERDVRNDLDTVMEALPDLQPHLGKCLGGEQGIDIEGLAVSGERLYFGFRGPAEGGRAPILSVDKGKFFAGEDADPRVAFVRLGEGRGIRDLQAVKDGILILSGPDDGSSSVEWRISLWDGASDGAGDSVPQVLAELDLSGVSLRDSASCKDKETKPEALAVLEDAADHYRVLILSDGMCDGGPLSFVLNR
jgi:hypothetical protein